MQKRYVLYGAGWEAERFYYRFNDYAQIDFVIDANKTGNFHGLKIYHFENIPCELTNYKIIIATEIEPYFSIRKLLKENGYHDYIWSKVWGGNDRRKIVVILANCYGRVYKEFLLSNQWFNERYRIIDVPAIHRYDIKNGISEIPEEVLRECDVYIHQDIRASNKFSYFLSDEYILPQLKKTCVSITVPNLVGFGRFLYPTNQGAFKEVDLAGASWTPFVTDTFIDSLYMKYKDINELSEHIVSDSPLSDDEVVKEFEECILKLKKREENWDIKISDFILENYKDIKLFYDVNHPTPFLMKEICKRLGKYLGLEGKTENVKEDLGYAECFVWPFVQNALGIHWSEEYVRRDNSSWYWTKFIGASLDVREYIREYIWWKYEKRIG